MEQLFHLALPEHWEDAETTGRYEQSTVGVPLVAAGFVHAATATQWPTVRQRFYSGQTGDLHLLCIDPDLLGADVIFEVGDPDSDELFPHIYGPIEVDAVTRIDTLHPPHDLPSDEATTVLRAAAVARTDVGSAWQRLTDFARAAAWLPTVRTITQDSPTAIGTRLTYLGTGEAQVATVTDLERGRRLQLRSERDGIVTTRAFHLGPATSGGAAASALTLVITVDGEPGGALDQARQAAQQSWTVPDSFAASWS